MPWDAQGFQKHNHSLSLAQAGKASGIANAILRRTGDEGLAIATANARAEHHDSGGSVSDYLPYLAASEMQQAAASSADQSDWRGGSIHRDSGGTVDPTSQIGGITPSSSTQNPLYQGMLQRYAGLPTEKLQELSARLQGSPQGALIQKLLSQRQLTPNVGQQSQQQPTVAPVAPTLPTAPMPQQARGGTVQHRDMGGPTGIPLSSAVPWFTRGEEYGSQRTDAGFLAGATSGRADQIRTTAPGGAFVIPADVVAGLGEGNSLAGARVMQEVLGSGPYGTPMPRGARGHGPPRAPTDSTLQRQMMQAKGGGVQPGATQKETPVMLSHGEFLVSPEQAAAIGGGDTKRGHRILEKWVVAERARQIKKLQSLPGPVKSKK